MPIGSFAILPDVVSELVRKNPRRVLDVGIGFGIYGAAIREWLEGGYKENGNWRIYVEGIEAFSKYENPNWKHYNKVIVTDILNVHFNQLYDAILLLDVIEHLEKNEGEEILARMKSILFIGGILLVGTPAIFCSQDAVYGNEYERHRSLWTKEDFEGFEILRDGSPDKYGAQMLLTKYTKS